MEVLFPSATGIKNYFETDQHIEIEAIMSSFNYYFYLVTKEALFRVDKLEHNELDRNYIFSTKKSESRFIPHKLAINIL